MKTGTGFPIKSGMTTNQPKQGGSIAGSARRRLEKKTGKKVVTELNAKNIGLLR